ncbi:hypothetical protein [Acidimangrovimonas sediminis]|uniref:hypothetical protein n=1 Tax=Acidimangrovimonas sediminis TaxID=2056283 RepID=UPI000C7FAA12|nr:hypothetical protein [Acidimangrovimonas sediminis]
MSDPMTRTDIEDVLSSIRRLVSEEGRAGSALRAGQAGRPAAPGTSTVAAPGRGLPADAQSGRGSRGISADAGRLVLTPALRVAGREDEEAAPEEATAPQPSVPTREVAASTAASETVAPEAKAPVVEAPVVEVDEAPMSVDVAEDWLPESEPENVSVLRLQKTTERAIESTIAELEAAVAQRVDQWDPDGTAEVDRDENHSNAFDGPVRFVHRGNPRGRGGASAGDRTPEAAPDVPVEAAAGAATEPTGAEAEPPRADGGATTFHSARRAPLRAPEASPEAAFADAPEARAEARAWPEPEPDTTAGAAKADLVDDDVAPTVREAPSVEADAWVADAEEAETGETETGETETGEVDSDMGPAGIFDEADTGYLDEDSLRELVREMIRQELQGSLGERITRNVRKLVRAEINRALASRDFQ